jgi:ABC-type lipoprotein release transport system permease subunit
MTVVRLIFRSLVFYARLHAGPLLGAAVGSAVLIGALVVGDSMRLTLRQMALLRLGKVHYALASGDRLFRAQLALELPAGVTPAGFAQPTPLLTASVLQLPGVATTGNGSGRANQVQVLGVDERFWRLADRPVPMAALPSDAIVLNQALAAQLRARVGQDIVLRVQKPSHLSRDAPLAPEEDATVALRLRVYAVVGDDQLGRFSLQASQAPPFNAFVSLTALQSRAAAPGRANLLLVGPLPAPPPVFTVSPGSAMPATATGARDALGRLSQALRARWQLEDAELEWRELPESRALELRSRRVFLDQSVADAVLGGPGLTNAVAARLANRLPLARPAGVLTYLVNELRVGERATPYSMVAAAGSPLTPADLRDDETLINQWLADDLAAKPGDELTLSYYVVGPARRLEERSARFRVRGVLPMNSPGLDRNLMPDFPGLTDAATCRDWDTGLPIQTDRIRDQDERYWNQYRGTPKALVTLAAGQKLWQNRFGRLTAVRFYTMGLAAPAALPTNRLDLTRFLAAPKYNLTRLLLEALDPAAVGLGFQPVREQALAAGAGSQDFGQLFLGFSCFLIAAALLLMAVLFQFGVDQRATEAGMLLALGFTPGKVTRVLLLEGGALAAAGAVLGAWGGTWYARAMLHGLSTVWREAVGGAAIQYHTVPLTLAGGVVAATLLAVLAMGLALRRQARRPAAVLLAEGGREPSSSSQRPTRSRPGGHWVAAIGSASALTMLIWAVRSGDGQSAGLFFGAGAALLVAGLGLSAARLGVLAASEAAAKLTLTGMGIRSATRRRKRSLAILGLLACGSFLIASIGVFKLDAVRGADQRTAGTGGFALIGESTQPVVDDLNTAGGQDRFGLDTNVLAGVQFVPLRVRDGDDASCLNLNRAQQPRLLGVRPELLARRHAFTFARLAPGLPKADPWLLLRRQPGDAAVPAIGDQASILWALGKRVGDTVDYTDERGRRFQLRLVGAVANSILQGSLLIAEEEFLARFPTATGYRMFLIDAPSNSVARLSAELTRGLQDLGLQVTPAPARLAAFNAVQNTYLGTFQALGGLGLVLGSVGLGAVVLRSVLERRGELALLLAVGFRPQALKWLVLSEHLALLAAGLGVGVVAALVAVLPAVLAPGTHLPYRSLAWTLAGVLLNGAAWTWLATVGALRGNLVQALRND